MSATVFCSRLICTNTWLIQGDGSSAYLVVGEKRGVVIDTGFALENIRAYAQALTGKPVEMAANTHGHFDHTGGNGWFPRAFMSARALEIAKTPYPSKMSLPYPLDYLVTVVGDGDSIDLGGRLLEVLEIPAHAPSSIAFLDRKERILFTGDEVSSGVMLYWQQKEPQPTVERHALNMKKLLKQRMAFDHLCTGHGDGFEDAALVEVLLEHDQRIMAGVEGEPFELRHGPGSPPPEDLVFYDIEFKRKSVYKETFIGYDCRYVTNP